MKCHYCNVHGVHSRRHMKGCNEKTFQKFYSFAILQKSKFIRSCTVMQSKIHVLSTRVQKIKK